MLPLDQLCENMTSSSKYTATLPDVDRPTATGKVHRKFNKSGTVVFEICDEKERQTCSSKYSDT